ncbi:hypothetical protein AAG570_006446 [Ranatra chinensis]|uniref:Uncharacterized protein n=1 Tax=Ranatra chinensis TaxID=642074 RepID=A0ABD0Z6U1_9HEMI
MHQEIIGNQPLVASVCEKAQQLVDQTKDTSLNTYLLSIKELFNNIVSKSQDLLNKLECSVADHTEFSLKCQAVRDWLNTEKDRVNVCNDMTGEKADIKKRIESLKGISDNIKEGICKLEQLKTLSSTVKKTTTKSGISFLEKDINKLEGSYKKLIEQVVEEHKVYKSKLQETSTWLTPLEDKLKFVESETCFENKNKMLQSLVAELEQASPWLNNLTTAGERLYPDTAASGRDTIRTELRAIRDR